MSALIANAKKFLALPPRNMALRIESEWRRRFVRSEAGAAERALSEAALLRKVGAASLADLAQRAATVQMPWSRAEPDAGILNRWLPDERQRVIAAADGACAGRIDLLGAGAVPMNGSTVDWHCDYRTGHAWPFRHFHELDPSDLDRHSDVKIPWELSRLQWLIPVAQAYRVTGEPRYAEFARQILDGWLEANPSGWGINWASTMEPAMRVITWCWLCQHLIASAAWSDRGFQHRFFRALYLHLEFVRGFIEISDVNGNHLTADAAALVVGGRFFGGGKPRRWMATGWRLLEREITRQVYSDGVDFEGSTAYHRLVAELFHVSAAAHQDAGGTVPAEYRERLLRMAGYTESYTRPDGLAPIIGDNDDARTLPLGGQALADHRYLPSLIRARWAPDTLTDDWRDARSECLWWWGCVPVSRPAAPRSSRLFPEAGVAILRDAQDYVYFSSGPLGLGRRGGHSHNDSLSFEAMLGGCLIAVDPGSPVYTGDYRRRNAFRSTAVHSTPQLGDEEINRFIAPRLLWFLRDDARAEVRSWTDGPELTTVTGCHYGYSRLAAPIAVSRALTLDKVRHALSWVDRFEPEADQPATIRLQLAPGIVVTRTAGYSLALTSAGRQFSVSWSDGAVWAVVIERGDVSPAYGRVVDAPRLVWTRPAGTRGPLAVEIKSTR